MKYKYIKKKSKSKPNGRIFFYLVFFIIMIYLFGYFLSFFKQKKTDLMAIEYAESDDPKIFSGVIIRDEKVYKSKKSGSVFISLRNLDIAKKDSVVCSICDKDSVKKLNDELKEVNDDILAMQKNRVDISVLKDDIKNAGKQIQDIIDNNIYLCSQNDLGKINKFADAIRKNLELRNQILLTENQGNIKELDEKKLSIEQQIKKNTDSINAEQTGIVSYFLDGLEENYKPEKIEKITNDMIKIKSQSAEISDNVEVKIDTPVFKIIESNDWYIICCVKNDLISEQNLKEGDIKKIYLEKDNDFKPTDFYIHKIWAQDKNQSYLAMRCDKFVQDYIDIRGIKFKFEDTKRHGFKIPVSAIDKKNLLKVPKRYNFVTKTDNGYTVTKKDIDTKDTNSFVTDTKELNQNLRKSLLNANNKTVSVKIYDSDENYFYVDGINLNDIIIPSDTPNASVQITDTKKIRGIYIGNTGVAEFKKINYDGEIPNNGFIILDPKQNDSLKINDRIVINLENIKDGEKIINH